MNPLRVCLLTEGTYPYVRGGVSTWCDELIRGLHEVEFSVYALIGNPSASLEYTLAPNIDRLLCLPLWGHESVTEYNARDTHAKGIRSVRNLRNEFVPLFSAFLNEVMRGMEHADPNALVKNIGEMYLYFRRNDYDWTMRRAEVWDIAISTFRSEPWHRRFMTTLEAIELIRSLYRYLLPLAIALPDADIMHTSVSGLCAIPAIAAKYVNKTPVILTEHGVYLRERVLGLARGGFPFSDRSVKKNLFSAIARATYACADVIAPVCSYNTTWEQFYGVPIERIDVIYNGVDEHRFEDRDVWPSVPTVSAVVRVDPLKDLVTMITAAKYVREKLPTVQFNIWGPVHDVEYERQCRLLIATLHLEETVHLRGSTTDTVSAYSNAHVVALSSISEGFPYSVIEAMMCGKPVVATDVGGIREAIGPWGTVVPPKHPDRFAEALLTYLNNPIEARRIGKGARVYALEHFTQSRFLENYRKLYAQVSQPSLTQAG